jgi:flagellar biosynthesis/type III secretory pathway M-ring protein FliF/YscJ
VHDSFGIDLARVHLLMDESSAFFSEELGYEVYCMFGLV